MAMNLTEALPSQMLGHNYDINPQLVSFSVRRAHNGACSTLAAALAAGSSRLKLLSSRHVRPPSVHHLRAFSSGMEVSQTPRRRAFLGPLLSCFLCAQCMTLVHVEIAR